VNFWSLSAMKIRDGLKKALTELKAANIGSYGNDAVILLKTALSKDEVFILSNFDYEMGREEVKRFLELLEKRKNRYPIAYITKSKEFFGFNFYVNEHVLIPRPETEFLVEETLKIIESTKARRVVDVGTGSGNIAITLSKIAKIKVFASDISKDALTVAKLNKKRLGADVEFIRSNGLDWLGKRVDIIVSNPPYVSPSEYDKLSDDVKFEPKEALISGEDGTQFIRYLLREAEKRCNYLIIEFGYSQSDFIKQQKHLEKVVKDLSGIDRVAVFKFS